MRVLVACEFSGVVRDAFTALGHEAWSCDLLPTERPGLHIEGDVRAVLDDGWDLMIAHPPCTYLTLAGVRWLHTDHARWKHLIEGAVFFRDLLDAPIPRIAVENPIMHGYASAVVGRKHDQVVQPWMFGHPESKGAALWLKGLPKLTPTRDVRAEMETLPKSESHRAHYAAPGADRWKLRSVTYAGLADAMAGQWGAAEREAVA